MYDVFISYASADEGLAKFVYQHLTGERLKVFLASVSLEPGQRWGQEILHALNGSKWVLFLASRAACASPWVQQELGAAIGRKKKLVPVVWDLLPSQLPGWASQFQALNLAGASPVEVQAQMSAIAKRIKADKTEALLIAGVVVAGLIWLITSQKG